MENPYNETEPATMADPKFDEPRIALNRIYTKTGDRGETHLAGGQRVVKWLAYPLTHTRQFDILRYALLSSGEIG